MENFEGEPLQFF